MDKVYEAIERCLSKGKDMVLVTLLEKRGTAPGRAGIRMLVTADGIAAGTVGGGNVEHDALKTAGRLLSERHGGVQEIPHIHVGNTSDGSTIVMHYVFIPSEGAENGWAREAVQMIREGKDGFLQFSLPDGMPTLYDAKGSAICAGSEPGNICDQDSCASEAMPQKLMLYSDHYDIPLPIGECVLLFGGGHVAQAVCPVLTRVGFRVTVIEERKEFAQRELFPEAENVICTPFSDFEAQIKPKPSDYAILATNSAENDFAVEEKLLRNPPCYVGVVGSKRKTGPVNAMLLKAGISRETLEAIHSPIGLPIGAVSPEEIAVSIAAELIKVRAELRGE